MQVDGDAWGENMKGVAMNQPRLHKLQKFREGTDLMAFLASGHSSATNNLIQHRIVMQVCLLEVMTNLCQDLECILRRPKTNLDDDCWQAVTPFWSCSSASYVHSSRTCWAEIMAFPHLNSTLSRHMLQSELNVVLHSGKKDISLSRFLSMDSPQRNIMFSSGQIWNSLWSLIS